VRVKHPLEGTRTDVDGGSRSRMVSAVARAETIPHKKRLENVT